MAANRWIKSPKGYLVMVLISYLAIATIGSHNRGGLVNAIVAVGVTVATDIILCLFKRRKRIVPDSAIITGLIISLILSMTTPYYIVAATSLISILSKHLLNHRKKPIFNPAAFGLLLAIIFFQSGQSWWGTFGDLSAWTLVLLLIGGYVVTNRVSKFPQVFAFLGVYFVILFIMNIFQYGDVTDVLRSPFINATLFFAFFMLTDPPTSPAKVKDQIIFGILTAIVGAMVYAFYGGLMYLFIGLLIGNLYHLLKIRSALKNKLSR